MIAKYPEFNKDLDFKDDEAKIEQIKEAITGIRNVRTKMNVHPSKKSKLIFITKKLRFNLKFYYKIKIRLLNNNKRILIVNYSFLSLLKLSNVGLNTFV